MSEMVGVVNELKGIISELKRLRADTIRLNKRKKVLEGTIVEYLRAKDDPGFKYGGIAVIAEEKEKRPVKKKSDKIAEAMSVLEHYGIENPKDCLDELFDRMKGSPVTETKLKIKEIKKK
jgi:hypothetical protein